MSSTFTRLSKLRGLPPGQGAAGVAITNAPKFSDDFARTFACGSFATSARLVRAADRAPSGRHSILWIGDWLGREEDLSRVLNQVVGSVQVVSSARPNDAAPCLRPLGLRAGQFGPNHRLASGFQIGREVEPSYFSRIKEIELNDASDIKVPWS